MRFGAGTGVGSRERHKWPVFTFIAMTKGGSWRRTKKGKERREEGKDPEAE